MKLLGVTCPLEIDYQCAGKLEAPVPGFIEAGYMCMKFCHGHIYIRQGIIISNWI